MIVKFENSFNVNFNFGVLTVKSDGFWNTDETLYHKATHNPVKNNFTILFQNDVEHESCLLSIVNAYVLDRSRIRLSVIIKWNILLVEFHDMTMQVSVANFDHL